MAKHIELFPAYEVGVTGPGAVLEPGKHAHRKNYAANGLAWCRSELPAAQGA